MRLALGCVLLLPAALHLLLCPSPAFTAPTTATHHPLPYPRYTRGDPLLGLGLLAGLSRHLSLTPQDTSLSPQPLDDLSLALMQRPPPTDTFPPLSEPLYQPEDLPATQDLSDFSLSDLDLLQGILGDLENGSGRQKSSTGLREKGRSSCRGYVVSGDVWCPSTLLQMLSGLPSAPAKPQPAPRASESPWPTTMNSRWLKARPSKRYLGIELPDYIATSYSSIKTDNAHYLTKLHQLKQRMRSAGK